jgi:hypothetical protein
MTPWRVCLVVLALGAVAVGAGGGRKVDRPREGVFAPLGAGQRVSLLEAGGRYAITVLLPPPGPKVGVSKPGVPPPAIYRVVEAGADYLVLEDVAGRAELRIPVYAVRSVTAPRERKGKD